MPNQKGSLKDRIRSWNLFLKYKFKMLKKIREDKKRKKELKQELKKNIQVSASGKYYSKPKVIGLTITGLFFGMFESKISKQSKIEQIENKVSLLETKADKLSLAERVEIINNIEIEIVELRSKNLFNDNIKSKIQVYENRLDSVKNKKETSSKDIDIEPTNLDNTSENINHNKFINKNYEGRKKGVYTPMLEIKVINKQVKGYQKKLKEINEKIKSTTDYNSLYELEFAIKQLKARLDDLLSRYINLKELPGFSNLENIINIEDIDVCNLRFNANSISLQIKECNNCLNNIEKRRKEFLNKKEEKVETKKEDPKQEKKKEKETKKIEKKVEEDVSEIKLANKIVLDRIASEKRNIEKFKRSISKMGTKKKKRSIFYYTKNILSTVVNFGLSLFPISLFKNKFIGSLTSGIMINNSLRSVRNILSPDVETIYILYSDFEKELNDTSNYLNNINFICNDSLSQINDIRNMIYAQYGSDLEYSSFLEEYLKELDNIELQVLREQQMVLNLQQEVSITKHQNKQKIKELRW